MPEGFTIWDPRGYHGHKQGFEMVRERVVPYLVEEAPHIATTVAVNALARKPRVWAATMILHAGYHLLAKYFDYSRGGGGPGTSPTSTILSRTSTGPSYGAGRKAGGPRKSLKRRSRPRRKCKPGYRWNGRRCVPKSR